MKKAKSLEIGLIKMEKLIRGKYIIKPTKEETMNPLHEIDKTEFDKYPAPLWEAWMKIHPGHINHTLPHYGPMFYFMMRSMTTEIAVEIGVAEGYTSFFMASAIKDNSLRYGFKGQYIGIDINIRDCYIDKIKELELPAQFLEMNSLDIDTSIFKKPIDFIFQDGCHDYDHCMKELELFYPLLKGGGEGYIVMHDVHYVCEEYFHTIKKDPRYNFEYVRFINNYGLAICRKMDGYNPDKKFCPEEWRH